MSPQNIFPNFKSISKKKMKYRRVESLCHSKGHSKSPFRARKLMVVSADNEGQGDKQIYVGQQYSLWWRPVSTAIAQ